MSYNATKVSPQVFEIRRFRTILLCIIWLTLLDRTWPLVTTLISVLQPSMSWATFFRCCRRRPLVSVISSSHLIIWLWAEPSIEPSHFVNSNLTCEGESNQSMEWHAITSKCLVKLNWALSSSLIWAYPSGNIFLVSKITITFIGSHNLLKTSIIPSVDYLHGHYLFSNYVIYIIYVPYYNCQFLVRILS